MSKKNIVIVGYPKSGTHWICRLVADVVNCPLMGDWGYFDQNHHIREGLDRVSDFQCSKSHHSYPEIFDASPEQIHKIIYVIRDPRDIVISGVYYFDFNPSGLRTFIKKLPKGNYTYSLLKRFLDYFISMKVKKRQMIKAVLKGNRILNKWCALSWNAHHSSYQQKDILFISYENMIKSPLKECKRIVSYLQMSKTDKELLNSIAAQSFTNRKRNLKKETNIKLLRKGEFGYWKKELTLVEKQLFIKTLEKDFLRFNY